VSAFIAKYSFGVYLTHLQVIWLCFVILRGHSLVLQWTLLVTLSIGIPMLLYHLVEEPLIKAGGVVSRRVAPFPAHHVV
jgi:peptidoglycan/LPS O-acetylase OafA/YrhL